ERGHLQVVDDRQPPQTGAGAQLAAEAVFVAGRPVRREELIQVRPGFRPRLAVPRERELRPAAFRLEPAAHEDVRAAHGPDDRACLPLRGRQLATARLDALDYGGALLPEVTGEVGPVFPESVADRVRIPRLVPSV